MRGGWLVGRKILEREAASSLRTQARTFSLAEDARRGEPSNWMGQDADLNDFTVA